jgi:hypothetical protein
VFPLETLGICIISFVLFFIRGADLRWCFLWKPSGSASFRLYFFSWCRSSVVLPLETNQIMHHFHRYCFFVADFRSVFYSDYYCTWTLTAPPGLSIHVHIDAHSSPGLERLLFRFYLHMDAHSSPGLERPCTYWRSQLPRARASFILILFSHGRSQLPWARASMYILTLTAPRARASFF